MIDLPRGSLSGQAHILVIVATMITALFILRLVRAHQLRSKYALLWLVIGLMLLILAAVPGVLNTFSEWLGVLYSPTLFLLLAVGFLFFVVVHYSWELSGSRTGRAPSPRSSPYCAPDSTTAPPSGAARATTTRPRGGAAPDRAKPERRRGQADHYRYLP